MIFMETPGGFSNAPTTVSLLDTHQLKFRLKALHAAHIALSVIPGHLHTYTYEFVLQVSKVWSFFTLFCFIDLPRKVDLCVVKKSTLFSDCAPLCCIRTSEARVGLKYVSARC